MFDTEVIGYSPVNFTDKETGRQIVGTSVYIVSTISTPGGVGKECTKHFLSNWQSPFIGKCNLEFNIKGKIVNILPVK